MNLLVIAYYLGVLLKIETGLLVIPWIIALVNNEKSSFLGFSIAIAISAIFGILLNLKKPTNKSMFPREGFVIVALSWIVMSLVGAIPFYVSRQIPSFVDCFFETVSGFTTTGASILTDVEVLSMSMLYWRSFTHWVGGMGVLIFILAIVPSASNDGSSMYIVKAESPGPIIGKLAPKTKNSSQILYGIYVVLTVMQVILLLLGGMPFFDSITTAFATAGTGGFAIKNASIAAYDSYYIQFIIALFMMLFGVNFNVYFLMIMKRFKLAVSNEELRTYWGICFAATLAIAINVTSIFGNFFEALHYSFFQVASIMTTTGFATTNFDLWPEFSRTILLLLMIAGASAGSTGGGIKTIRIIILMKSAKRQIQKMLHPNSVKVVRLDKKSLDNDTVKNTVTYFFVYALILCASTLLISVDNKSFTTNISAVLATINNIGPGLEVVGPLGNYSSFSVFSKLILCFDMLAGRLELFPMLILFAPSIWKRARISEK